MLGCIQVIQSRPSAAAAQSGGAIGERGHVDAMLSTVLALTRFRDNVLKANLPGANLRASYPNSQI